ncbi:MAG: hypothetical protein ACRYG7_04780 [Janthinobacterium lividum]
MRNLLGAALVGVLSAFSAAAQVTVPGQASVPGAMAIPATPGRLNPPPGIGATAPGQPGIPTVTGALPSGAVVPSAGAIYGNNSGRLNNNSGTLNDPTRNDPTRTYSSTDPANPANSPLYNGTGTQNNNGMLNNQGMLRPITKPATTPATRPTRRATTTTTAPVRTTAVPLRSPTVRP